ncbi:MAG: hypothetical protein LBQ20_05625 [Rhodanobacter sp.]|jgi:hypothetical protein|nr:hypothetical protein [Rhodanobacter sp.]
MSRSIDDIVKSVAVLADSPDQFCAEAKEAARELGVASINLLAERFHAQPAPVPAGFGFEQRGLGGWLAIWQFAIFEILYNFRETALPVLRLIAFGKYDWTQGNAIEVLCRLAADGVDRERTLNDLKRELPSMRYEAYLYAAGPLLRRAASEPEIAVILQELESVDDFREAVEELREN